MARFGRHGVRYSEPVPSDAAISHEDNLEFEHALREHGKEYELIEYEGAPHSFFDRKQEEFKDASDDAWRRVLEFIGRNA